MGHNDHLPTPMTRSKGSRRDKNKQQLDWSMADAGQVYALVSGFSLAGGYAGFGRNKQGTCLLLYIKLGDWEERIPIETQDDILPTMTEVLSEL